MAYYRWQCKKCQKVSRALADTRPTLVECGCGGEQVFLTAGSSMVKETLDNGLMVRKVERLANVEELLNERNVAIDKPDDPVI